MMTPLMAVAARHCPEGAEATMYASLYMILNWSSALATAIGAALTRVFGVSDTDFHGMPALMLACNLCMLLPLPLLLWMPAGAPPPPPPNRPIARAASQATGLGDGGGEGAGDDGAGAVGTAAPLTTALTVRRLVPLTPAVSCVHLALPSDDGRGGGGDGSERDANEGDDGAEYAASDYEAMSDFGLSDYGAGAAAGGAPVTASFGNWQQQGQVWGVGGMWGGLGGGASPLRPRSKAPSGGGAAPAAAAAGDVCLGTEDGEGAAAGGTGCDDEAAVLLRGEDLL